MYVHSVSIFVLDVFSYFPQYSTGTMRTGDQILAINGESLHMKTVPEAVQMLQRSGDVVTLKICKAIKKSSEERGREGVEGKREGGRNGLLTLHYFLFWPSRGDEVKAQDCQSYWQGEQMHAGCVKGAHM